jgi:hypothetical protein
MHAQPCRAALANSILCGQPDGVRTQAVGLTAFDMSANRQIFFAISSHVRWPALMKGQATDTFTGV